MENIEEIRIPLPPLLHRFTTMDDRIISSRWFLPWRMKLWLTLKFWTSVFNDLNGFPRNFFVLNIRGIRVIGRIRLTWNLKFSIKRYLDFFQDLIFLYPKHLCRHIYYVSCGSLLLLGNIFFGILFSQSLIMTIWGNWFHWADMYFSALRI